MKKNQYYPLYLIVLFSLVISACVGSPANPAPAQPVTTQAPVAPPAPSVTEAPANAPTGNTCIAAADFEAKVNSTKTVSELLSELDRDFNLNSKIGGAWTQEMVESTNGFTVPAGSAFWTDLFDNIKTLPAGVKAVRTQGGWGIYTTTVAYKILLPNGGGRFANICGGETPKVTTQSGCASMATMSGIGSASDPVAFNAFFESTGYAYGMPIAEGGKVPAGYYFLGTFPSTAIPSGVTMVGSSGFVWFVTAEVVAPNGGRAVKACQ
ncbi:hypothetical protein A2W24_02620 [Microgenomates group bacterium RBG_16_45_19]|nr:MAG: hypothetical protein A2W24_02620 [Microgenomates group bacterium RBG_16_45_19]